MNDVVWEKKRHIKLNLTESSGLLSIITQKDRVQNMIFPVFSSLATLSLFPFSCFH